LNINGEGTNVIFNAVGKVGKSLAFLNQTSFVQTTGLVLLGTAKRAYSFAVWINPIITNGGTILHVSGTTDGLDWCVSMLGFTNASRITAVSRSSTVVSLVGSIAAANRWTHLAVTYGTTNGIRLWINGTQYGAATGAFNYAAPNKPVIITLGSSLNGTDSCHHDNIQMQQYTGYMDEFQLYSRELSSNDIRQLANI
jgi:hypothetical protein